MRKTSARTKRKGTGTAKPLFRHGTAAMSLVLTGGLIFSFPLTANASPTNLPVPAAQAALAETALPDATSTLTFTSTSTLPLTAASTDASAGYALTEAALTETALAEATLSRVALARATVFQYSYPAGSMAVSLTLDGVPVLTGACAEINGTIYVPVERFVNLFGSFDVTYTASPEQVTVAGDNLSIQVHVGDAYITVNGRVLYTGAKVLSLRGWIFAPLPALATAVNAQLTVKQGWYQASLTSGNPAAVASASQVYNSTDLYWLSRIISAEAKGESLEGQIAVGNVVLNRVRSSEFPSTVKEVIFDTKYGVQFSPVSNGTIYDTPTESAVLAAKICLEGYSLSDSALYFFNPALATSSWIKRSRTYIMTIGNHAFYA